MKFIDKITKLWYSTGIKHIHMTKKGQQRFPVGGNIMTQAPIYRNYDIQELSKYLTVSSYKNGTPISNLQLQKVLYFIYIDFLKNNIVLVNDNIEAWQYGPVFPTVYKTFKVFCNLKITKPFDTTKFIDDCNSDDLEQINTMVTDLSSEKPWELVNRSHETGTPWAKVFKGVNTSIPSEILFEFANNK